MALSGGIPALYTRIGVGTIVAEGKPVETFEGKDYDRWTWLRADLINPGRQTITALPTSGADSVAMIRGGHIDMGILWAMKVTATIEHLRDNCGRPKLAAIVGHDERMSAFEKQVRRT